MDSTATWGTIILRWRFDSFTTGVWQRWAIGLGAKLISPPKQLKRRLNTIDNHMGATEAAPYSSRKCKREDVEPRFKLTYDRYQLEKKIVTFLKIFYYL